MKTSKFKRLLSALLIVCTLFGIISTLITVSSVVAYADEGEEEEIEFQAADLLKLKYKSADEKLATMKKYITYNEYELYALEATGEVAIKNTKTGQIMFSNPWSATQSVTATDTLNQLFSQIYIDYQDNSGVKSAPMYSFVEAAQRDQIKVSFIKNGISVEYTIGRADDRHLVPRCIERSRFENLILAYMVDDVNAYKKMGEGAYYQLRDPFDTSKSAEVKATWAESYPIIGTYNEKDSTFEPNMAIYVTGGLSNYELNKIEEWIRTWCPHYTYDDLEYDHELTKYTGSKTVLPVFKLALEYTLTPDGVEVRLPANSISFNEEYFTLNSVTVLPYMGAGSADYQGFTFVPDGSGSIIRFEDIKGVAYNYTSQLYGPDYAYHTLKASYTGKEQIARFPVVGLVEKYTEDIHYNPDGSLACGHIYVGEVTAPTCTEQGYTTYTCKFCGKSYVDDYTDPTHTWDKGLLKKPTCTEGGYTLYTCTVCGETKQENPTEPTHTWNKGDTITEQIAPKDDDKGQDGVVDHTCEVCGEKMTEILHNWDAGTERIKATEEREGSMYYTCLTCGAHKTEVIPKVKPADTGDGDDSGETTEPEVPEEVVVWDDDTYIVTETKPRGFVAIITSGDSLADITSAHAGTLHKYNSVFITVNPRPSDKYNLRDSISVGTDTAWTVVSKRKYTGSYTIKYIMLNDAEGSAYPASYEGMAKAYRDYLIANGTLTKLEKSENIPLYLETFGCVDTNETVASIPIVVSTSLTPFDSLKGIVENLTGAGVSNINFKLTGYANGGYKCTVPYYLKFEKSVGGNAGYTDFVNYAKENGVGVFPEFDFAYEHYHELFDGYKARKHAVKTIDDRYITSKQYDSVYQIFDFTGMMAISPSVYDTYYEKFGPKLKELGTTGISVSTLGTDLNSDFDEDDPYNREDSKRHTKDLLDSISADYGKNVMISGGNAYAYSYAGHILNVSLTGSEYLKTSASVPFISMVLHGYINYAGTPTNMASNVDMEILNIIENGASPYFIICGQNITKLKEDKELSKYYSISFDTWRDDIVTIYKDLNAALGDVQNATYDRHAFITGERIPEADELSEQFDGVKNNIVKAWKEYIVTQLKAKKANNLYERLVAEGKITAGSGAYYTNKNTTSSAATNARNAMASTIATYSYLIKDYVKDADGNPDISTFENAFINATDDEVVEAFDKMFTLDADMVGKYDENGKYVIGKENFADSEGNYLKTTYTVDANTIVMCGYDNGIVFVLNKNSFSVIPSVGSEMIKVTVNGQEEILQLNAYGYAKLKTTSDGKYELVLKSGEEV